MGFLVKMIKWFCESKDNNENKGNYSNTYWCEIYKVRGINPKTKRKKSVEVVESSNASAELIQSKSGLLPPYEIEVATRPASDAQLDALRKHGFTPPANLSMSDAGIFIDRGIEGEPRQQPVASLNFVDYAIKNDVYIPKYANTKEARDYLLEALPENAAEIKKLW